MVGIRYDAKDYYARKATKIQIIPVFILNVIMEGTQNFGTLGEKSVTSVETETRLDLVRLASTSE